MNIFLHFYSLTTAHFFLSPFDFYFVDNSKLLESTVRKKTETQGSSGLQER